MIVTGTGRCGSQRFTRALQQCGLEVRQEQFFNPYTYSLTREQVQEYLALPWSDVSWMAAPHLGHFPDVPVIHLVRHPVDTVNSYLAPGPWIYQDHIYTQYIARFLNNIWRGSEVCILLNFWLHWNLLCEQAPGPYLRVNVEWLTDRPVHCLLVERFLSLPEGVFQPAWRDQGKHTHRGSDYRTILQPGDLDLTFPLLQEKVIEYGYQPDCNDPPGVRSYDWPGPGPYDD